VKWAVKGRDAEIKRLVVESRERRRGWSLQLITYESQAAAENDGKINQTQGIVIIDTTPKYNKQIRLQVV
jgi:hypothetical protein